MRGFYVSYRIIGVKLKQFLAVIYLVIFFFGAVMHEKKNIILNDLKNPKLSAILEKSNPCDSSESHGNSDADCSSCHFGHCSMMISAYAQAVLSHDVVVYPRTDSLVYLYNHQFGLFRPPIA